MDAQPMQGDKGVQHRLQTSAIELLIDVITN